MATQNISLKLLVDKKDQRVLFAEATKEFIDFLFHIFSLPLGTLIEFLGSNQMVGCLGKLKDSIESFNETYLQPGLKKDDIFNPKTPYNGNTLLLSYASSSVHDHQSAPSKAIYRCSSASSSEYSPPSHFYTFRAGSTIGSYESCRENATLYADTQCPSCRTPMNVKMNAVIPKEEVEVKVEKTVSRSYVKEVVTYMVMDDLVVKPMSTISSITIMNGFGVKDLSQLEEKMVSFGKDEALRLLKASLMTGKVLTTLFLHNHSN